MSKEYKELIVGLDIGTSKVVAVVASVAVAAVASAVAEVAGITNS